MAELPTAGEITALATLLVPGLIILDIRARFKEGAVPELKEKVIGYGVASVAYYAVIGPLFHVAWGWSLPSWLWGLLQFFVVPVAIGAAVVWFDQTEHFYRFTNWLGLRLSHHVPAAWDYAFSRIRLGTYVLVKLNDGTEYAGIMGKASFASSSQAERDLLLEEVWSTDANGAWTRKEPRRAVLLCGKDIRYVEIFYRSDP